MRRKSTVPESKQYQLAVLNGDGIGPEIVPASVKILDAAMAAAGAPAIVWTELPLGRSAIDTHGTAVPAETLEALNNVNGWLLGPHDSASYPEPHKSALNPSGTIRKHFGLFANIRPAKAFPGGNAIVEGTDLVIVRENTEGFYADRNTFAGTGEFMPTPDVAIPRRLPGRRRPVPGGVRERLPHRCDDRAPGPPREQVRRHRHREHVRRHPLGPRR
jgi:3-isopropylmalate dehydrogenase